jgi:hypothetical protein
VKPLAIMLCADRVPIVRAHFKSAMTQTGSPDPWLIPQESEAARPWDDLWGGAHLAL